MQSNKSSPKTTILPSKSTIQPKIVMACPIKCSLLWWFAACNPFNEQWKLLWSPQSKSFSSWSDSSSWKRNNVNWNIYWKDNDSYIIILWLVRVILFPSVLPSSRSTNSNRYQNPLWISLCLFPATFHIFHSIFQFLEWSSPSQLFILSPSHIISHVSGFISLFHFLFPSPPSILHFFESRIIFNTIIHFCEFWFQDPPLSPPVL